MKRMVRFDGDRGLSTYIDPDEVSQVIDSESRLGTCTVTMKNGSKVFVGTWASEAMRRLEAESQ